MAGGPRMWAKALKRQVTALNKHGKDPVKEVIPSFPPVVFLLRRGRQKKMRSGYRPLNSKQSKEEVEGTLPETSSLAGASSKRYR